MQSHYWNNTLNAFYHKTLRELKERGLDPMKIVEIESEELDRFYQSIKDEANG
ncbi:MAG: hypothetical protein OXE55_03710 [Flavobacteriaceae bacterium]|nr:hypothetical protein [Flavobacteriaceae bacterium]MCY4254380.1 hypothetical protein [Flavobacteriaceae bacterium]